MLYVLVNVKELFILNKKPTLLPSPTANDQ